jgi:hypothetical protein
MTKSATEIMQEVLVAAVLDSMAALKAASKGVPNTMLRDINALHANTTFADFPKELQDAIAINVRAAFTRLLKEGYAVAPRDLAPRTPPPRTSPPQRREPRRDGPPRRDRAPDGKPPRGPGGGRGRPSKPKR